MPTLRSLGLGRLVNLGGAGPIRRAARCVRPDGRSLAGQGFGHRALGADGAGPRAAFPVFPDVFPAELIGEFERRIGRKILGNKVVRYGDHRRARPRAHGTGQADRLHLGRQRLPDRRARRRHAGARAVSHLRDRLRPRRHRPGVGRVIARPFVGIARRVQTDREPPRFRADAVRPDPARQAEGGGHAVVAIGKIRICSPAAA